MSGGSIGSAICRLPPRFAQLPHHIEHKINLGLILIDICVHQFVVKKFNLCQKTILFGFSRGGLYAFNYALFYPEAVEKIYLDAPVLNLKSWPNKSCLEFDEMLERYNLNESAIASFKNSPVDNLEEFSKNGIPVLIVAGAVDTTVPHKENCQIMVDFYKSKGLKIKYILKENCGHHPHGLEDVSPIIDFVI